jgi:hypothetical protein
MKRLVPAEAWFRDRRSGQNFGGGGAIAGTAGIAEFKQKYDKCPIMSHNVPSGEGDMGHGTEGQLRMSHNVP